MRNIGLTGKNPSVACLIVDFTKSPRGQILSFGITSVGGSPHAEVNALNKITKNQITKKTVMYVSLEPCFKKLNCCAKQILKKRIPKIFISSTDPNPLISGKGLSYLKKNNIKVINSPKKLDMFKNINKHFYYYYLNKRPYITLKLAVSKNGFSKDFDSPDITSDKTQYYMHKYRLTHDAIAIGYNTYKDDNPKLSCRLNGVDKNISKFVISHNNNKFKKFYSLQFDDKKSENSLFNSLNKYNIKSILIEGGANTFNYFFKNKIFDEIIICQSNKIIRSSKLRYKINLSLLKKNLRMYSSYSYNGDMIKIYK
tara:strand:- start:1320 stop:2255 length:936 start_codon:yes stop_codon:yes gene_type:complete